ncbi:hypothetical protein A4X13_0g6428 [Tilletia indica]|uniref:Uncharacterized protein n=1 Tax=Tilletia indica TaxID=43049 RepID=A0A177T6C2_9BASI|nr:hypothetical protein A4X13_0g6428 [Tilletia indica]
MASRTGMNPGSVRVAYELLQQDVGSAASGSGPGNTNWADMTDEDEAEAAAAASLARRPISNSGSDGGDADAELSETASARAPTSLVARVNEAGQERAANSDSASMQQHSFKQPATSQASRARSKTPVAPTRPRSTRVAAVEAAKEAALAQAATEARLAQEAADAAAATSAAIEETVTSPPAPPLAATGQISDTTADAPSAREKTASSAIDETLQALQASDKQTQLAANARTKSYAGLMAHMEKMHSEGHVGIAELDLLLAACKAAHRHAEAGKCAPAFPPVLVDSLANYDVKHPENTLRKMTPHLGTREVSNHHSYQVSPPRHAPTTYGAIAARNIPPPPPPAPFSQLRDKHIVGQGKGSALDAALKGGHRDERLFVRLPEGASVRDEDPLVLVERTNKELASAGAPPFVRTDLISKCPTGLAVSPRRGCSTEQLFEFRGAVGKALGATVVETDEVWERWVIYEVPTHAGSGAMDEAYLSDRLSEAFPGAVRGTAKRLCKKEDDWTTKEFTPVAFYTAARANFFPGMRIRMLGRQFMLRRHQLRPTTVMCGVCGSYRHQTHDCPSGSRCRRCSKYGHSEEEHVAQCAACKEGKPCVPQCMHCRGPHVAGDRACKNKPVWNRFAKAYVLSAGQELSRINALGDRSRNKMLYGIEGPASGANKAPLGVRAETSPTQ